MSVGTTARVCLRRACLVRYATYLHDPGVLAELGTWKAAVDSVHADGNGDAAPPFSIVEKFRASKRPLGISLL